jgi:hypothetical protein
MESPLVVSNQRMANRLIAKHGVLCCITYEVGMGDHTCPNGYPFFLVLTPRFQIACFRARIALRGSCS